MIERFQRGGIVTGPMRAFIPQRGYLIQRMAKELQPIHRCESCGFWQPRYERAVNAKPICPHCCSRCPPGFCTEKWHRIERDQPRRSRPLPVYLTAAVRKEPDDPLR